MILSINGNDSTDRNEWRLETQRFGIERFGQPNNNFREQRANLERLESEAMGARIDGRPRGKLELFDVLQGRAEPEPDKSGSTDLHLAEMYKLLPFCILLRIWTLFDERLASLDTSTPPGWQLIQYIGLWKDCGYNSLVG